MIKIFINLEIKVIMEKSFLPQITIDRKKHKYFELSGVNEITVQEFRHSHVSLLINKYAKTVKQIQQSFS